MIRIFSSIVLLALGLVASPIAKADDEVCKKHVTIVLVTDAESTVLDYCADKVAVTLHYDVAAAGKRFEGCEVTSGVANLFAFTLTCSGRELMTEGADIGKKCNYVALHRDGALWRHRSLWEGFVTGAKQCDDPEGEKRSQHYIDTYLSGR